MQSEYASLGGIGDGTRSVGEAVEAYALLRATEGLSAKTLETDLWRASLIVDGLGQRRVRTLSVGDCDAFLRAAADGTYSSASRRIGTAQLRRIRAYLIRVLKNEMRLGMLHRNAAELSVLPSSKTTTRERRALTQDEFLRLRCLADGSMKVLIELSGRYALRPAESRAVAWKALDYRVGVLHVGPRLNRDNELIGPKTKAATRTIQLADDSLDLLGRWQVDQEQQRSAAGPAWSETGLIVTSAAGTAVHYGNVQRSLAMLSRLARIAPAVSHYELRHTAITFQAEAGHSAWRIADWAGTSERMISLVYRHIMMETSPLDPPL